MNRIAVVVPTIREEMIEEWKNTWQDLLVKHRCILIIVQDGDVQSLSLRDYASNSQDFLVFTPNSITGDYTDLILKKTAACRNLGFAYISRFLPDVEYIMTFDDDVMPINDPIQEHIDALNSSGDPSWMNTAISAPYMRGYPYYSRGNAYPIISHGVWHNVPDLDAPTQLLYGDMNKTFNFYKGIVPNGVYMPMCGMNIAFRRTALGLMYYAPAVLVRGAERFDDIWMGIRVVRILNRIYQSGNAKNFCWVSGYSEVNHTRMSNVYSNLVKESYGIGMNDRMLSNTLTDSDMEFLKKYDSMFLRWNKFISQNGDTSWESYSNFIV